MIFVCWLLHSRGEQKLPECVWSVCSLYNPEEGLQGEAPCPSPQLTGPSVTGVTPTPLPTSWQFQQKRRPHMSARMQHDVRPSLHKLGPFSHGCQDPLCRGEPLPTRSQHPPAPSHAHCPGPLLPDHSFSRRVAALSHPTASFSRKEKGGQRPEAGSGSSGPGRAERQPRSWHQACAHRGRIMEQEEDVACGDSRPRSPPLATRQAGLGQDWHVVKLLPNRSPRTAPFCCRLNAPCCQLASPPPSFDF